MDIQPTVLFDANALTSVYVAGDNLDEDDSREAAAEDQQRQEEIRQELNEMVQNQMGDLDLEDLLRSSDDEDENDEFHGDRSQQIGDLPTEGKFGKTLNRRNAKGIMATSTPFAPSQRYKPHADLLRHETLSPHPVKNRIAEKISEKQLHSPKIAKVMEENNSLVAGLTAELEARTDRMNAYSNANRTLNQELQQCELELENCRQELNEAKSLLKANREALDALKTEKHELLKENFRKEETIKQLNEQVLDMTSWRTVEQLKKKQEEVVLQLKELHDKEMSKLHEGMSEKNDQLQRALDSAKNEAELLHIKLKESESRREAMKEQVVAMESERKTELETKSLLKANRADFDALVTEKLDLLKENFRKEEIIKQLNEQLRDMTSLSTVEQLKRKHDEIVSQMREQHAKEMSKVHETMSEKNSHLERALEKNNQLERALDKTTQLERALDSARNEAELLHTKLKESESRREALKEQVVQLESERKNESEIKAMKTSRPELDALKTEKHGVKLMESQLKQKMRKASDENADLREEHRRLNSEIYGMKKVLKKLKKYISGNPSPSGDSGISGENKNDIAAKLASMPAGDGITRDANYVNIKELISLRDNVVRIIDEYRSELEHKYQQQLETDRKKIISQIDGIYTRKLQQVLLKMKTTTPPQGMGTK
ncbi:myosin-15-like isoform X2 [Paramacrobiotus metropolitanus]|uniref:myosin-15-like isoform X2 n=1 Tax=Paramacrobiotus metropolitanus TaxID=2943436 RepID=UPI002445CF15|nr:myosin-15-like isoform X2 [Paramacrobiotus metropolitanus]